MVYMTHDTGLPADGRQLYYFLPNFRRPILAKTTDVRITVAVRVVSRAVSLSNETAIKVL